MAYGRQKLTVSTDVVGVESQVAVVASHKLERGRIQATSWRRSAITVTLSRSVSVAPASARLYLYCTLQPLLTIAPCPCSSYWAGVSA